MTIFNLKHLTIIFLIIFILLSNIAKADYPNTSVGIVDLNLILLEADAAKDAAAQIEQIAIKIEEEIKDSDDEIINEQNKLIESQAVMAPEAFEIKRQEYEKKVQNYNVSRQEKLRSIDNLLGSSRNKVLDALKPILENISNEKGITVMLEKSTVLLSAESMDITQEVLKALNKELPSIKISQD